MEENRKHQAQQSMQIPVSYEIMGCYFANEKNQKQRRLDKSEE